jgi:hypothetical protein
LTFDPRKRVDRIAGAGAQVITAATTTFLPNKILGCQLTELKSLMPNGNLEQPSRRLFFLVDIPIFSLQEEE